MWRAELRARIESLQTRAALRRCTEVGARPRLFGRPLVANRGKIIVGDDFALCSVPVRSHLIVGPGARLELGDRVRIACGASISAHGQVTIGDDVVIGPMCVILDVDYHEVDDRDARGKARPVRIGNGVRLGSGVVILRGAIVGDGARVAPNSVVSRFVPPGVTAEGVPARPVAPRAPDAHGT